MGYVLCVEGIWKGDIWVSDVQELQNLDASENLCSEGQRKGSSHDKNQRRIRTLFRRWIS